MTSLHSIVDTHRAGRIRGALFEILETLALTAVIFIVIQTFVAQPFEVRQQSMETTLEPGQYVLVDKLTPRWDEYKPLDIIVFDPPANWIDAAGSPFIKRVIGVGGDEVEVRDGFVFVNGRRLPEPYLNESAITSAGGLSHWLVPTGDVFVMGDNRSNSVDSRVFGPVPIEDVVGRAW